MEKEERALSWREFVESGFDGREYQFPDFEGTFAATIACKRWDRNKNLLAYLDFDVQHFYDAIRKAFFKSEEYNWRWYKFRNRSEYVTYLRKHEEAE